MAVWQKDDDDDDDRVASQPAGGDDDDDEEEGTRAGEDEAKEADAGEGGDYGGPGKEGDADDRCHGETEEDEDEDDDVGGDEGYFPADVVEMAFLRSNVFEDFAIL